MINIYKKNKHLNKNSWNFLHVSNKNIEIFHHRNNNENE